MNTECQVSETDIIKSNDLFKMDKAEALAEVTHQLRVIRLYTMTQSLGFLDYLVRMAEMEARRVMSDTPVIPAPQSE